MKGLDFPIEKTKGYSEKVYNLSDPEQRKAYFYEKAGKEIDALKDYFAGNTFIAYLLGKKQAGKGTYSKLLMEIFGNDKMRHLSVGDIVRETENIRDNEQAKEELVNYLKKSYRGFISIDDALDAFFNRSASKLLPTEFILMLVKREIDKTPGVSLLIDGFPRDMDQISYSLYFRELINHRDDPDMFVLFDVPEQVIDERIKYRRICPQCKSSFNTRLLPSTKFEYDESDGEIYMLCDNPNCSPVRLVGKEGDELGIEVIRDRIETDDQLIRKAFELHNIPKILLRNAVPKDIAYDLCDEYEITKGTSLSWDKEKKEVVREDSGWEILDDNGIPSYSLYSAAVAVSFIKQLKETLIGK